MCVVLTGNPSLCYTEDWRSYLPEETVGPGAFLWSFWAWNPSAHPAPGSREQCLQIRWITSWEVLLLVQGCPPRAHFHLLCMLPSGCPCPLSPVGQGPIVLPLLLAEEACPA